MARTFIAQFANQVLTVGQLLAFDFNGKKLLALVVKDIEGKTVILFYVRFFVILFSAVDLKSIKDDLEAKPKKVKTGLLSPNSSVQFVKAESSSVNLIGSSVG